MPRPIPVLATTVAALLFAMPIAAQRGGGQRRPKAVLDRVGAFVVDIELDHEPLPADPNQGPRDADLLSPLAFVGQAQAAGLPAVIYLVDRSADADRLRTFERALFAQDDLGIAMRRFACGRIDLASPQAGPLRARYGKDAPVFVVCGKDGKPVAEAAMPGMRASAKDLEQALGKAFGKGDGLPMAAFVKRYKAFARDLEQLEQKKTQLDDRDRRVDADDKQKRAAIQKERRQLEQEEQKLMAEEREILDRCPLPARPEGAQRLGGRGGGRDGERDDGGDDHPGSGDGGR